MPPKRKNVISLAVFVFYTVSAVPKVQSLGKDVTGPVVVTNVGPIRGVWAGEGNDSYSMFMGIPYAEVDKNNIFGPALKYPRFENMFDAFDDSAICPQIEEFNHTIVGTLECLHLNVYVPNSASAGNELPILVWIHGGAFSFGFAGRYLYGPSYLIRHDVIVITLNYRLGPYGFICPGIPEVSGNQGLKDQVLALRWIKENIRAFGGDNTKVTLAGHSAGGLAVDLHLHNNQVEQLFQKIIIQSGVILMQKNMRNADSIPAQKLAKHFNYTSSNVKEALSFLATLETDQLIAAVNATGAIFAPCIENKYDNVENFITRDSLKTNLSTVNDIDILIGFSSNESLYMLPNIVKDKNYIVDKTITDKYDFEDGLFSEMKEIVSLFYLGDAVNTDHLRVDRILDMASDFDFKYPILKTVQKYSDSGFKDLYLYFFSYYGERNLLKRRFKIEYSGAAHSDELGYLFDVSYMKRPNAEDLLIIERITKLWTNFIKLGNPTPEPTELIPLQWPVVTQKKQYYLEIDLQLRVVTRPFHDRMAFLDLFHKVNGHCEKWYKLLESAASSPAKNAITWPLFLALKYFVF